MGIALASGLLHRPCVLINCLYAGQHEMSHWTAFRSRRLNDFFGEIIGFVVIYPFTWDRWFHFTHHAIRRNWEKDPELLIRALYAQLLLLKPQRDYYWWGRVRSTTRAAFGASRPTFTGSTTISAGASLPRRAGILRATPQSR